MAARSDGPAQNAPVHRSESPEPPESREPCEPGVGVRKRHRPSEPYAPRPGDLLADRLRAFAAWATRVGASTVVDGARVDGTVLSATAQAQQQAEAELLARWRSFRGLYAPYLASVRLREGWMRRAIESFEQTHLDAESRRALRLCKLRRPPLAKVEAVVASASTPPGIDPPRTPRSRSQKTITPTS